MYELTCMNEGQREVLPVHAIIYAPCGTGKSWAERQRQELNDTSICLCDTDDLFAWDKDDRSRAYIAQPDPTLEKHDWLRIFGVGFCKKMKPTTFNVILTNLTQVRDLFQDECLITMVAPKEVVQAEAWLIERTHARPHMERLRQYQAEVRTHPNAVTIHHSCIYPFIKDLQHLLEGRALRWTYRVEDDEVVIRSLDETRREQ